MNISSYMPVEIFCGEKSIEGAGDRIAALGKKALIVTGGTSAVKSGALADVIRLLGERGISYRIFDKIEPNPRTATCHAAGREARAFGAAFLIGIGGGSPLDAAKAIGWYAANEALAPDDIYGSRSGWRAPLPSVLVGTTAGTGSEVTGVSVLTGENGRKKSISGFGCYGTIAVCDYRYTFSVPYGATVSTALDAFAHATESYFANNANTLSESYALAALPPVWEGLTALCRTGRLPDAELREKLYIGSLFAGLAINITGTLFPHSVGYILTEARGLPHGRATAAFAPLLFARVGRFAPKKAQTIFSLLDSDERTVTAVLRELTGSWQPFSPEEARALASRWENDVPANFTRSPGSFTAADGARALQADEPPTAFRR